MNINWTLLGQSISFIFFVWFCLKYIWPPITAAMRERQQRIAAGLAASEEADNKLKQAEQEIATQRDETKAQVKEIIEKAEKRALQIEEDAKVAGLEEGQRMKELALAEIEQEKTRAREELRSKMSVLVFIGVEKILGAEVDTKKHAELVNQLAKDL